MTRGRSHQEEIGCQGRIIILAKASDPPPAEVVYSLLTRHRQEGGGHLGQVTVAKVPASKVSMNLVCPPTVVIAVVSVVRKICTSGSTEINEKESNTISSSRLPVFVLVVST